MAIAPFIRPIKNNGGTFYTFSSAAEDLGFSFNQDDKKFRFSKFALLNIPDIKRPTLTNTPQNYIQFDAIPGAYGELDNANQNRNLAESFQNYCLNLEAMLIGQETYDADAYRTVSERVFWKWMKEVGAVRFKEAGTAERASNISGTRYTEELSSNYYERVVEYIGEIDVTNSVKHYSNSFSEVYIHVPTDAGNTPLVLFNSIEDHNYKPGMVLQNKSLNPTDLEYLYGRGSDSVHPAGLKTEGFFDSDDNAFTNGTYTLSKWNEDTSAYVSGKSWFSTAISNAYFTEPTFNDAKNDKIKVSGGLVDVEYQRSRLDGISIDFNSKNYAPIINNARLNNIQDFNNSADSTKFEYNAILLYYDLFDPSDEENTTVTNLFGVLFLDAVSNINTGGGTIATHSKFKPNYLSNLHGNSYSYKINIKFDINSDDAVVVQSVNDYNTFSMELFSDAMSEMQKASSMIEDYTKDILNLRTEINELRNIVYSDSNKEVILSRLTSLEEQLKSQALIFDSNKSLVKLINKAYDEVTNIYKNYTSVSMAYNLDVIGSGRGIKLDKSSKNKVKVVNGLDTYGKASQINVFDNFTQTVNSWDYVYKLNYFTNYLRIHDVSDFKADRDIVIRIDDKDYPWENGQVLKLVFASPFIMSSNLGDWDFYIYTDSMDKLNAGSAYSKMVIDFTDDDFTSSNNTPIFEITCLDNKTFTFVVDKIR